MTSAISRSAQVQPLQIRESWSLTPRTALLNHHVVAPELERR